MIIALGLVTSSVCLGWWVLANIDQWIGHPPPGRNSVSGESLWTCQWLPNPNRDVIVGERPFTDIIIYIADVDAKAVREIISAYRSEFAKTPPQQQHRLKINARGATFKCLIFPEKFDLQTVADGNLPFAEFDVSTLHGSIFGWNPENSNPAVLNYEGASFQQADLQGAKFLGANLRQANFWNSKLDGADFSGADLTDANFESASVVGVIFEPRAGAASDSLRTARGLETMTYNRRADALLQLRDSFKKAGRRDLERQITYAIERTKTRDLYWAKDYLPAASRFVAWQVPTAYDLEPERALLVLACSILLFALPYAAALWNPNDPKIWRVLPADRLHGDGKQVFEALRVTWLQLVPFALLFSIFSAFQLGWRDLNVGTWLTRLQGTEYALRGSGWVRTLSGFQSLLSVYLLAMWVLTQFGRLFDG